MPDTCDLVDLRTPLASEPPEWTREYIGLPFREHGRSREGVDCYGLVRLVHREQLGISLPAMCGPIGRIDPDMPLRELRDLRTQVEERMASDEWTRTGAPELVGDIAWMTAIGAAAHVGLAVSHTHILHIEPGGRSMLSPHAHRCWGRRIVDWIRYSGSVRLAGNFTPFGATLHTEAPAGLTITQILAHAGVPPVSGVRVRVGGTTVDRKVWDAVRPLHGQLVTVAVAPLGGGGGKSPLRLIATIGIIAAAAAVPGLNALAGTSLAAGTIGGALLSAGISAGGFLLLNALVPAANPRLRDSLTDTSSPSLTSSRNELRPWRVFPAPLGDYRWAPPLGAVPYTEVVGDDQYLRLLYILGRGPKDIQLADIKVGDTKLTDLTDYEIEIRQGYPGETPPALYPSTIVETGLSVLLEQTASWTVRTTAIDAEEISLDVTFPNGLASYGTDGSRNNRTVDLEVQYAVAGSGVWKGINAAASGGSPLNFRELDYLYREPEATLGGRGTHAARIAWDAAGGSYPDSKPGYLPSTGFAWEVVGYVYAPTTGTYWFQVDGNDACDVHVDWQEIASWYGSHDTEVTSATLGSGTHRGSINLTAGYHAFRARVECRTSTHGALAVSWKKPGDSVFSLIPNSSFARSGRDIYGRQVMNANELDYRWYTFAALTSELSVTEATGNPLRKSKTWAVTKGQYDVRIRRTTADTTDTAILDKVYWTALRTIRPGSPIKADGVAQIALRIKATDQLQGALEELNVRTVSILPDYDSGTATWIPRPTRNAASILRGVFQGPANRKPVPDSKLNLASFEALHADGYTYDAVIDQERTVWDVAREVAAAARASIHIQDGKITVVRDRVRSTHVDIFTPRNSRNFRWRKIFTPEIHGLRITFTNEEKDYTGDERLVFADGYDENTATKYRSIEAPGTVDSGDVWKRGRYELAVAKLRPEIIELEVAAEQLTASRGDMILVQHDVLLVGYCSGRVLRLILDDVGGNVIGVHVDEACVMEAGKTYALRIRRSDGTISLAGVVTEAGSQTRLLFLAALTPACAAGDLFAFGESGLESREYIITAIKHGADFTATLELVDHAPAVHSADTGTIPDYDSGTTRAADYLLKPDAPVIDSIRSDDYVMVRGADGSLSPRMLITLKRASGAKPLPVGAVVRTRAKPPTGSAQGPYLTRPQSELISGTVSVDQVEEGVTYEVGVRVVTAKGVASGWTSTEHTIIGKTGLPPDVVSFDATRLADGTRRYTFDLGSEPPDIAGVLIRVGAVGAAWGSLSPVFAGVIEGASPYDSSAPLTSGLLRYAIKMVDTSGNESANMIWVERDLGAPPLEDTVISEDARRLNWSGTKSSCQITTGNVLEAVDTTAWSSLTTWAAYTRWNINPASPISYTHGELDLGIVAAVEPAVFMSAEGTAVAEVAWGDTTGPTNWTAISGLAGTSVRGRYFRFRVTVTASVSFPVPVIKEFSMYLRAKQLQHEIIDADTSTFDSVRRVSAGVVRLPIPVGLFTQIRRVSLSFNGVGVGWTWEVADKDAVLGPLVRLYDTDGNPADATIDAVIRGL
jgi:hypothetical protein